MKETMLCTIGAMEEFINVMNGYLKTLKIGIAEENKNTQPRSTAPDIADVLDIDACAKLTKMSKSTLYKACANRTIPHFKSGKRNLFHRQQVVDWLLSNKIKTMDEIARELEQ